MTPSFLIAIPTGRGGWAPDFVLSLINVIVKPMAVNCGWTEEPTMRWEYQRSANICQNRHNLVKSAMALGVSHILWLDDDMTFPPDTLERLIRHGLPIVAANCTTRVLPIIPTAVKNDHRITSLDKSGLESVDQLGLAVVLTETKVFASIPMPWFKMEWDQKFPDTYMTEDCYFFRKAREAGYRTMIDHDLSKEIGHIGEITYDHSMVDDGELAELNARYRVPR